MKREGNRDATRKQWEHTFRAAKRWYEMAKRFGDGLVFYLPTQSDIFSSTWYAMYDSDIDCRFAKLKNQEFSWWMDMIEEIYPTAKERLTMFREVAIHLKEKGTLASVHTTAIESDERWVTKRKNILIHSMEHYDNAIRQATERPHILTATRGKRKAPTVGIPPDNMKRQKSLGMLRMKTTVL